MALLHVVWRLVSSSSFCLYILWVSWGSNKSPKSIMKICKPADSVIWAVAHLNVHFCKRTAVTSEWETKWQTATDGWLQSMQKINWVVVVTLCRNNTWILQYSENILTPLMLLPSFKGSQWTNLSAVSAKWGWKCFMQWNLVPTPMWSNTGYISVYTHLCWPAPDSSFFPFGSECMEKRMHIIISSADIILWLEAKKSWLLPLPRTDFAHDALTLLYFLHTASYLNCRMIWMRFRGWIFVWDSHN